jgi:hypothetical protein
MKAVLFGIIALSLLGALVPVFATPPSDNFDYYAQQHCNPEILKAAKLANPSVNPVYLSEYKVYDKCHAEQRQYFLSEVSKCKSIGDRTEADYCEAKVRAWGEINPNAPLKLRNCTQVIPQVDSKYQGNIHLITPDIAQNALSYKSNPNQRTDKCNIYNEVILEQREIKKQNEVNEQPKVKEQTVSTLKIVCGEGTIDIDGICQVEKQIEPQKKPKKSSNWFSVFWSWFS